MLQMKAVLTNEFPSKTTNPSMLLFLVALSIFTLFLLARRRGFGSAPRRPPGPPGLPVIGNLHQLDASKLHLCLTQLSTKYGPLMYLRLGRVPVIVISSAEIAKEALKHNDLAFSGRPPATNAATMSYNHRDIVSQSYSEYWREMRKMVVLHLFTLKQVRSFRPFRENEVSRMIRGISKQSDSGHVVNLHEAVMSFSSNLVCRIVFGKELEDTGPGPGRTRQFDKLLADVQGSLIDIFIGDYVPSLGWIDRFTGAVDRIQKVFKSMDSFLQDMIDEHLSPIRPVSMNGDILDLLIQLRNDSSSPAKIDWDNIKAILKNIFVAGTDTSAATIIWVLTALIKKPSAMKKVQEEIRALVGNKGSVDEDDTENLPYLKAVIKETMRLYPPLPLLVPKETTEKCTIGGYEIQPKTFVHVNAWAIGRDPEYWDNPNEFLPERFLNSSISYKGQDFGLLPFGSGRRMCPGLSLGVAAVEMALANLLYSFDWGLPDGMTEDDVDTDAAQGLAMHRKSPLCLVAKSYI